MSLRYALLGMLDARPASGYELTAWFEQSIGKHAWHARHGQVYPELKRLADENLATVIDEGPRGRRTYALTDAGRTELTAWLRHYPDAGIVRNEYALRMFLLGSLSNDDARSLLESYAQSGAEQAEQLRMRQSEIDQLPVLEFGRLAAEFGRRYFELQRDWARWAIDELTKEQNASSQNQGGSAVS